MIWLRLGLFRQSVIQENMLLNIKDFFSWKKGFASFVNGEWGNNVFPKDVAIEKANELFDLMNYKIKRK